MSGEWHLDKKVSMGIIASMIIQASVLAWSAGKLYSDVEILKARPDLTERVIRVEAKTDEHGRILQKLDDTLDRINITLGEVAKEQAKRTALVYKDKK